jgi:hypothetical protein
MGFSKKMMGKEVGDASIYAKPHTMDGKAMSATVPTETGAEFMNKMNPSVAGISKGNYQETKTSGIKMRGTGAATKGTMSRGPMA